MAFKRLRALAATAFIAISGGAILAPQQANAQAVELVTEVVPEILPDACTICSLGGSSGGGSSWAGPVGGAFLAAELANMGDPGNQFGDNQQYRFEWQMASSGVRFVPGSVRQVTPEANQFAGEIVIASRSGGLGRTREQITPELPRHISGYDLPARDLPAEHPDYRGEARISDSGNYTVGNDTASYNEASTGVESNLVYRSPEGFVTFDLRDGTTNFWGVLERLDQGYAPDDYRIDYFMGTNAETGATEYISIVHRKLDSGVINLIVLPRNGVHRTAPTAPAIELPLPAAAPITLTPATGITFTNCDGLVQADINITGGDHAGRAHVTKAADGSYTITYADGAKDVAANGVALNMLLDAGNSTTNVDYATAVDAQLAADRAAPTGECRRADTPADAAPAVEDKDAAFTEFCVDVDTVTYGDRTAQIRREKQVNPRTGELEWVFGGWRENENDASWDMSRAHLRTQLGVPAGDVREFNQQLGEHFSSMAAPTACGPAACDAVTSNDDDVRAAVIASFQAELAKRGLVFQDGNNNGSVDAGEIVQLPARAPEARGEQQGSGQSLQAMWQNVGDYEKTVGLLALAAGAAFGLGGTRRVNFVRRHKLAVGGIQLGIAGLAGAVLLTAATGGAALPAAIVAGFMGGNGLVNLFAKRLPKNDSKEPSAERREPPAPTPAPAPAAEVA